MFRVVYLQLHVVRQFVMPVFFMKLCTYSFMASKKICMADKIFSSHRKLIYFDI